MSIEQRVTLLAFCVVLFGVLAPVVACIADYFIRRRFEDIDARLNAIDEQLSELEDKAGNIFDAQYERIELLIDNVAKAMDDYREQMADDLSKDDE